MTNWFYENKEVKDITDMPSGAIGFTYCISFPSNGDFYLGKKNCYHRTNPQISKKKYDELKAAGKPVTKTKNKKLSKPGKPVWRYKQKDKLTETNWKTYTSSSDIVNERISKGEPYTKTIVAFYSTSKELTFREIELIIKADCLDVCECLNKNILAKFFKQVKC